MKRLLPILIIVIAAGLLVWQQVAPTVEEAPVSGEVINMYDTEVFRVRNEKEQQLALDDELRRGEHLKTKDSFLKVAFGGAHFVLAKNTEILLLNKDNDQAKIRLLGGRVVAIGATVVETPWITITSYGTSSVVNYAFDSRVQILPLTASVFVDNDTITYERQKFPSQWFENEKRLERDVESFNPELSSESEFYAWAIPIEP